MTSSRTTASAHQRALPNFLLVGAVGFLVDAAILTTLLWTTALAPWQARICSFLPAVLVTWLLNRRHTFAGRGLQRAPVEAIAYLAIQTVGAGINFATFILCLAWMPQLRMLAFIPLAAGSAVALLFNYTASSLFIYSRPRP